MIEIRSIQKHARAAVDQQATFGTVPINPFQHGTDEHKQWKREFIEYGSKPATSQEA